MGHNFVGNCGPELFAHDAHKTKTKSNNSKYSPIVCETIPTNENNMTVPTYEKRSHAYTR